MKRKITMIAAYILSVMLLVCVVSGSYAEMSDDTILNTSEYTAQEETSEAPSIPEGIPDETPATIEAPVTETEENPDDDQQEAAGEPVMAENTEQEPEADPEPASDPEPKPASQPDQESVSEPNPEPEPEPEPATEPETEPATEPETEPTAEPETEPAAEPETEPAAEPETEPATEPDTTSEPEKDEPVDQPGEAEPEAAETEEDEPAEEATADPEEPDEDGLFEFDDDDHGFIEPAAMPAELATVTPEMKYEGITELQIGAEVSGTATAAPGSWHYIRSGSARTVQLTLYAAADIQVQVNDQPVQFEAAEDADGNECMACRVNLREGETYICLIGSSVSYRLKASLPSADERAEKEAQEEEIIREEESPAETADEPAGTGESAASGDESGNADAPETANTSETTDNPETTETTEKADAAEAAGEDSAGTDAEAAEPDPDRYVVIHSSIEGQKRVYSNSYVKLTAELFGYEGTDYTVQWYYSPDQGATRIAIPGADSLTYIYRVNDENIHYLWSVTVTPADGK